VRKWLRQESKDFYAEGFDARVKRWDASINAGRRYVEKCFPTFKYHMFFVSYPFVTYSLTFPRTSCVLMTLNTPTVRTMRLYQAHLFLSEYLTVENVSRNFEAYDLIAVYNYSSVVPASLNV
jgi:hypothetical protein